MNPRVALVAVVVLAAVLRIAFFVGLASGDPQDDGVYYGNALSLYREGPRYLERFRDLPATFVANPIDQFHVRPMVTYPIATAFILFGPGEVQATLWPFVCSMLTVLVVYRLGLALSGPATGVIAAFLCAIYPLEVINGTRILSDVPVGFFSASALWLLVESLRRSAAWLWCFAAGIAVGGAYLANGRGLVVLGAILACSSLLAAVRRTSWRAPTWCLAGFGVVFGLEAAVYGVATGDPLLNYHIHSGAATFKYLHEPVSTLDWGWFQVYYTNGRPLELVERMSRLNNSPTDQLGWFFYLFGAAAVFCLIRRRHRLLLLFAAALMVYFEFGPVRITVDWPQWQLNYYMVFKQERFLLMVSAPLLVMAASGLHALRASSAAASAVVLMALTMTSVEASARTRAFYRGGVADLRAAAEFVATHRDRVFFGDWWAVEHVRIFTGYSADNLQVLSPQSTADDLNGACVMLGGSRGAELMAGYVESTLPSFARDMLNPRAIPAGWSLALDRKGAVSAQRLRDFRIYCKT